MPSHEINSNGLTQKLRLNLSQYTHIDWLAQTGSTNADLMAQPRQTIGSSQLLGADLQIAGRGRAGRAWHNTAGQSLTFSCGFETALVPTELTGLSLALGVGACEALRALCTTTWVNRLKLKWPNDLMLDDGKLAGILVETQISHQRVRIVVGIGINLSHAGTLSRNLGRQVAAWESLQSINEQNLSDIVCAIATAWHRIVFGYAQATFKSYVTPFAHLDYLSQQPVLVMHNDRCLIEGIATGVNLKGALTVTHDQGVEHVTIGDVSIRLNPKG